MLNGNIYHGEQGYIDLMRDILERGVDVPDRTGVGSRAMFDAKVVYAPGEFPFSTVRPASARLAFEEFWFFMSGSTQTKRLEEKKVFFWQGNTTREFLDKRGLSHLDEGDMGMAYGHQLRSFNKGIVDDPKHVVDQLRDVYETLKSDPYSRRVFTTLWNPSASPYMALTPCWHSHQFVVLPDEQGKDTLHLKMVNRSLDACFGAQFALQQYRMYQMCLCKLLGFELGSLSADLTQVHLYANQLAYVEEILTRDLGVPGTISLTADIATFEDMLALSWDDWEITGLQVNYAPMQTPRPPMAA